MIKQNHKNQTIKVVFVGPPQSGKSCIVSGYTDQYKQTIGVDVSKHNYVIDDKQVTFQLWDISASMTFNDKNLQHVKEGQIVVLTFAVDDRNSFIQLQSLAEKLLEQDRMRFDAKVVIVGTKGQLIRQVQYNEGLEAAEILRGDSINSTQTYFQLSTKTDSKATENLCRGLYQVHKDKTIKTVAQLLQGYKNQQTAPYQSPQSFTIKSQNKSAQPVPPPQFSKLFKVILKGDQCTGKSAILFQFAKNQMINQYLPTIGVDFNIKIVQVQGEKVKLQIWDTAGMKKFSCITANYIKGCQIIILVYDVSNYTTFTNLPQHIKQISTHQMGQQKLVKIIAANKIDLQRKVSKQQGEQFAQKMGYQYIQVSALQRINIDELFINAADCLIKKVQNF